MNLYCDIEHNGAFTSPKLRILNFQDFFNRSGCSYKKAIQNKKAHQLCIAEKCRLLFGSVHEFDDGMRN